MTKDILSEIIYKHYVRLGKVVEFNKKEDIAIIMTQEEIKELHSITILAYYYLTGKELLKEPYKEV